MEDASITEMFRKRDENAIAELKNKYGGLCMYIAGNILSQREDAEECVNTAYYEIWNRIPPEIPDDLKTYLCRIVRNIAIKRLEYNTALKRSPSLAVSLEEIGDCMPSVTDDMSGDELADAVSRFLRTQDELRRRIFVRRYWYGDTLADIAERFGINERTAATYLFRTRKKLKAFLQKEGYCNE